MKYIYAILLVLIVSGCSVKQQPPVAKYALEVTVPQDLFRASNGCLDKSLKVAQAFSSSSLMSKNMDYTEGKNKQYSYSQAQWYESPNRALSKEFTEALREAQIFKSVQNYKSVGASDWLLEISIEDLMQYFDEKLKKSYVKVSYTLTLINNENSQVLATKTFERTIDAKALNASGGVEALNEALSEAFVESMNWINGICQ